jgi:hypothetical protein
MTEAFILFNYFQLMQSFAFAIRKRLALSRENSAICAETAESSRATACKRNPSVRVERIVTSALRTRRHLDGSYGIRDGG